MKLNKNVLKRMISILCVASISISCLSFSVGAVKVAPSMIENISLVYRVDELNRRLDDLKININKVKDKAVGYRNSLYVYRGQDVFIQNRELDYSMGRLIVVLSDFDRYIDVVKDIDDVKNKDGVTNLSVCVNSISKDIEKNLFLSDIDFDISINSITKDIVSGKNRVMEYSQNMKNNESDI